MDKSFRRLRASWPRSLLRDLRLAASNVNELPFLFTSNPGDAPARPETSLRSYENVPEIVEAAVEPAVPRFFPFRRKPYTRSAIASEGIVEPPPGELWLYVNGVATSRAVLKANGKELARIFQRPIHLVHNPTDGIVLDLGECILGRTFNWKTMLAGYVLDVVSRALRGYSKVVLIGHSQGGIVVADVANALVADPGHRDLLPRLEIYTFASAADEMRALNPSAKRPVPYYEHFANGRDFIARFGVISCRKHIAGRHYVNEQRTGHLLNAHYLPGFENGEYCGKKSRLFHYVGGKSPPTLAHGRPRAKKSGKPRGKMPRRRAGPQQRSAQERHPAAIP